MQTQKRKTAARPRRTAIAIQPGLIGDAKKSAKRPTLRITVPDLDPEVAALDPALYPFGPGKPLHITLSSAGSHYLRDFAYCAGDVTAEDIAAMMLENLIQNCMDDYSILLGYVRDGQTRYRARQPQK